MQRLCFAAALLAIGSVGCGDDGGLDDYYPTLPPASGARGASAGQVTDPGQLIAGPARSGLVGDYFIRNDVASFIVQGPTRVIGVVPQGGNLVDAAYVDASGELVADHFGELSLIYLVGRTCAHERVEVVRDGKKGGPAVLRAIGKSGNNDFINLKGVGVLPVIAGIDPYIDDEVQCATTYVLAPGAKTIEVYFSLYNDGDDEIAGPMGVLNDSGGAVHVWSNTRGFGQVDISELTSLGAPAPSDYVVYQGPRVAYGLIPRHDTPTVHSHVVIAGVSIFLSGNAFLLEVLQMDKYFLRMPPGKGYRQRYDLVVGPDAAAVDAVWRSGETPRAVAGRVDWSAGGAAAGARVGIFEDTNGNGQLDAGGIDADGDDVPDERAVGYLDVASDGSFSGPVPATGNLLVRAEVKNQGRSQTVPLADTVNLTIPSPMKVDYQILDAQTSTPIPGRLIAVGTHPAFPDTRVFDVSDRASGVVDDVHAIRGTSVDAGSGADPALYLPAGGTYRVYASRGTEWSVASQPVSGTTAANLSFSLRRVVPTDGYLATDWHVHQIGSPDSTVLEDQRIRSLVSAGVEMFAATDHDYVADLQPLIEQMNLGSHVRAIPGVEVTPFVYGHFNGWPITPDPSSANGGAIDWGSGREGFAMVPGEIFSALRERGAEMIQVNHPRSRSLGGFQGAFERATVKYDFDSRTIFGDYLNSGTPNEWLRLPEESLWSDQFNGLEVWNGFSLRDSNGDMLRELDSLDRVLRDWFSMLSLGFYVTPAGNSDTHTLSSEAAGLPRTYVRVPDDSAAALANGSAVAAVLATQTGANATPRDVVVTNGPMIDVRTSSGLTLGRVVTSVGVATTFTVTITSPDWAEIDTLEVFANSTPAPLTKQDVTVMNPLKCWTSRTIGTLHADDPCSLATLSPEAMSVNLATLPGGGGFRRYEATVAVTLDVDDITTRAGATGRDAWLVFRVRGDRGIFPIVTSGAVNDTTLPALLGGDTTAIAGVLQGRGVPAAAFTAPIFMDFDGGGYRAPFAP